MLNDWINIITAIGTIGSCIVAIWLAYDSKRKKLDCVFIWRREESYIPFLLINNICDTTIIIEEITFIYKGTIVGNMDFLTNVYYSSKSVVEARSKNEIAIKEEDLFDKIPLNKNSQEKHYLFIIVKSTTGKNFVSSCKYSDSDICNLFNMRSMYNS